jgi:hypothetical protein
LKLERLLRRAEIPVAGKIDAGQVVARLKIDSKRIGQTTA